MTIRDRDDPHRVNPILAEYVGQAIDVYADRIMLKFPERWWWCLLPHGWFSVADYVTPNAHTRAVSAEQLKLLCAGAQVEGVPIRDFPWMTVCEEVDDDVFNGLFRRTERFGFVETIGERPPQMLIDDLYYGTEAMAILADPKFIAEVNVAWRRI